MLKALWDVDPWGEQRADFRQAMTTAKLDQVFGDGEFEPNRYLYRELNREPVDDDETDYSEQHAAAFAVINARLERKNRGRNPETPIKP